MSLPLSDQKDAKIEQLSYRHNHLITAMELRLQFQYDDFASIDNKAQQYINLSAIMLAIISGFSLVNVSGLHGAEKILIFLLILSFAFTFYHFLNVIKLINWRTIESHKFPVLKKMVKTGKDLPYFDTVYQSYYRALRYNGIVALSHKRKHLRWESYGAYFQIVVVILLAIYAVGIK